MTRPLLLRTGRAPQVAQAAGTVACASGTTEECLPAEGRTGGTRTGGGWRPGGSGARAGRLWAGVVRGPARGGAAGRAGARGGGGQGPGSRAAVGLPGGC